MKCNKKIGRGNIISFAKQKKKSKNILFIYLISFFPNTKYQKKIYFFLVPLFNAKLSHLFLLKNKTKQIRFLM